MMNGVAWRSGCGRGTAHDATPRCRRGRVGSILLTWSLALSMLLMLTIVGYYPLFQTAHRVTERSFTQVQALHLAEAGVDQARWYLQYGLSNLVVTYYGQILDTPEKQLADVWPHSAPDGILSPSDIGHANAEPFHGWTDCLNGCWTRTVSLAAGDDPSVTVGSYTVTVTDFNIQQPHQPVITSVGSVAGSPLQQTVRVVAEELQPRFRYPVFGNEYTTIKDGIAVNPTVDSYDSSVGPYSGQTPGARGHIGTNAGGSVNPDVMIGPQTQVRGNVYKTSWAQTDIQGTVNGSILTQQAQTLPAVVTPDVSSCWGSPNDLGNFSLSSGTQILSSNTLYCARNVNVSGTGILQMDPGARLYIEPSGGSPAAVRFNVAGNGQVVTKASSTATPNKIFVKQGGVVIDMTGGTGTGTGVRNMPASTHPRPGAFQFYLIDAPADYGFILAQKEPFYGVVYAPDDAIDVNAFPGQPIQVYGSLIAGRWVRVNNGNNLVSVELHYDTQLTSLRLDGQGAPSGLIYKIRSWDSY